MILEISDDLIKNTKLSESELRLDFALFLYNKQFLTLEQASKFAGIDIFEFQKYLGEHKIPIHYNLEDFNEDLEIIKKLA